MTTRLRRVWREAERDLRARYRRDGYLAARVEIRTEEVPGTSERDVTVVLDAGEQARVGQVRFEGDTGLPAAQLEKALKLRHGQPYKESLLREDARAVEERLRGEDYYEARVTAGPPDWSAVTNRVDLDFQVASGPRYRVEFEGRGALSQSDLRSQLTFAVSGVTDRFEQEASARQIEVAYRERGYHWVAVEPHETRDGDVPVIRFAIDEGPRVTVESVEFTGNREVSSSVLAKQIETSRPALFRRGLFSRDLLDHDVGVVLAYLRTQGYADAKVGPAEVDFSADRAHARIAIPVDGGAAVHGGRGDHRGRARLHGRARSRRRCRSSPGPPGRPEGRGRPARDRGALRGPRLSRGHRPLHHRSAGLDRRHALRHRRGRRRPASGACSSAGCCSRGRTPCGATCRSTRATC